VEKKEVSKLQDKRFTLNITWKVSNKTRHDEDAIEQTQMLFSFNMTLYTFSVNPMVCIALLKGIMVNILLLITATDL
jgi:hypothetical protein